MNFRNGRRLTDDEVVQLGVDAGVFTAGQVEVWRGEFHHGDFRGEMDTKTADVRFRMWANGELDFGWEPFVPGPAETVDNEVFRFFAARKAVAA